MNTNFFALWPILPFGGEDGEGTPAANEGEQAPAQGGTPQNQKPPEPKGGDDSDDGDDSEDEYKGYTVKELRRIAADNAKKAADAEREAKKLKDKETAEERKKNDENTNLKNDVAERDETIKTIRATMTQQAIHGAIRDDQRYTWNDVGIVAGLLDPEVVKVSDQGKVEGLKAQLTKISKEHPFLLKSDNTNDQGRQQNNQSGPTGFQPGQGGASGGGAEVDRKKLAEEYPALAGRV